MTSAVESLLGDLARRGVVLMAEDGRLRFRAPRGALTPELRAAFRERGEEIIAILDGSQAIRSPASPPTITSSKRSNGGVARPGDNANARPREQTSPQHFSKRCNLCKPEDWLEEPDPGRSGWIRATCGRCGKFLGYRPRDV